MSHSCKLNFIFLGKKKKKNTTCNWEKELDYIELGCSRGILVFILVCISFFILMEIQGAIILTLDVEMLPVREGIICAVPNMVIMGMLIFINISNVLVLMRTRHNMGIIL